MAQSPDWPDLPYVQAKSYGTGRDGKKPTYSVIHYTAGSERSTAAEDGAAYDARRTDGVSTHYFCVDPGTRVLTTGMTWVPAESVRVGDTLVGVDEYPDPGSLRRFKPAEVTSALSRQAQRRRLALTDGRVLISSSDHRWLAYRSGRYQWVRAATIKTGHILCAPLVPWGEPENPADFGWLGGILDGEGCYSQATRTLTFAQREGIVLDRARAILDGAGIPYSLHKRPNDVTVVTLSGIQANMRVLGQARPVRFVDRPDIWSGRTYQSRTYGNHVVVAEAEDLGPGTVVSLTTTARTFVAEGVVSHNCDRDSIVQCVRLQDRANAAFHKGNRLGIQYELCGTVQTRAQWLDAASYPTLQRAAYQVARDHHKFAIPVRRLTVAQVRACWYDGAPGGICGHVDVTYAYPEDGGTHTDPGAEFPWDVFMDLVADYYEEDGMTPEQERLLRNAETYAWKETVGEANVTGIVGGDGKPVPAFTNVPHKQRVDTLAKLDQLLARPAATPPPADLAAQIAALLAADEAFLTAIAVTVADVQAERLKA